MVQRSAMCRSRRELSNEYLLASLASIPKHFLKLAASASQPPSHQGNSSVFSNFLERMFNFPTNFPISQFPSPPVPNISVFQCPNLILHCMLCTVRFGRSQLLPRPMYTKENQIASPASQPAIGSVVNQITSI